MDYSKPVGSQLIASGRIKTKSKDFFTKRYRKHYVEMRDLLHTYQPDYVGIEKPPPQASYSAGLYPIWIGVADVCTEMRIPFATWLPTSIKAVAKGLLNENTKMFKSDMVEAAQTVTQGKAVNHNIADSILVNWITYRLWGLVRGLVSVEDLTPKEVFLLTRTHKKRTGVVEKKGMLYKESDLYYDLQLAKYDYLYPTEV